MIARHLELGREAVAVSGVPWAEIRAVGIACGGPLDPRAGIIQSPLSLPGWDDIPLVSIVSEALDRPAVVDNDATAGALAEWRYGAGARREVHDLVYLTISTGVGGGSVVDGRLYRGASGNGGELGHVTVDWQGRECRGCGRRGCLEAYVSGTSIAERAAEAGLSGASAADVAAAARAGEPRAVAVWDETVKALACGVTSIVNLFDPEMVVVGGGVSGTGEQLLGPVRARVNAQAMSPSGATVKIVGAALGERVGVVGAAATAIERAARTVDA